MKSRYSESRPVDRILLIGIIFATVILAVLAIVGWFSNPLLQIIR